jgi:hypothetical protein
VTPHIRNPHIPFIPTKRGSESPLDEFYKPTLTARDVDTLVTALEIFEENLQYNDEESPDERIENEDAIESALTALLASKRKANQQ